MTHETNGPPLKRDVLKFLRTISDLIENIILWSRYMLVALYLFLMVEILLYGVDFFKLLLGCETQKELTEHTMKALDLLDQTMIANLIWFISAGSFYVFVHIFPDMAPKPKPRSLTHISTGILKEKMAGSIVGVSSIYLLETFLHVMEEPSLTVMQRILCAIGLHCAFIVGLLAFNYTNKADHHAHNKDDGKENEHEKSPH